jgi:hypothetical protein
MRKNAIHGLGDGKNVRALLQHCRKLRDDSRLHALPINSEPHALIVVRSATLTRATDLPGLKYSTCEEIETVCLSKPLPHPTSGRHKLNYYLRMAKSLNIPPSGIGLCADCQHMRLIKSDRGATFYFCQRSATDPKFPKYPRLPVLECSGYEQLTSPEHCPASVHK